MSGGSFNYLCSRDLEDILYGVGEEWDSMLHELDSLCPEAASEMRKIRTDAETFVKEHDNRWNKLTRVLHAVEWWRSNDYGKDQVDKAIKEYMSETVEGSQESTNG
jgi:hypothetical protein